MEAHRPVAAGTEQDAGEEGGGFGAGCQVWGHTQFDRVPGEGKEKGESHQAAFCDLS